MAKFNDSVYNWHKMEIGDEKKVSLVKAPSARAAARAFTRKHGYKFESEKVDDKVVIRRIG
jgi:hypothetical protein